ncbi:hypothetical protein KKD71_04045, partial [Patescibacteria group bacterium]|nr:hypothetical protein [Patescibacteria group bacterium]
KREEAEIEKNKKLKKLKNKIYQRVELDGDSLLKLAGMEPGPEFGKLLRAIQAAVEDPMQMPALKEPVKSEIERRILKARKEMAEL